MESDTSVEDVAAFSFVLRKLAWQSGEELVKLTLVFPPTCRKQEISAVLVDSLLSACERCYCRGRLCLLVLAPGC